MPVTTYSPRNTPTQTQGTVEPIKLQINTHGQPRSQVGMSPRHTPTPSAVPTNQTATLQPIPEVQGSQEVTKSPTLAEDPQLSSKFAALARKEKAIRQRQLEIQQKETEMQALNEEIAKAKAYRERLKSNPLDVLNEEGITYDQLVQRAVATGDPNARQVLELQAQIKGLEDRLTKQQEESKKYSETQREQAVRQMSMDVKDLISSDPRFDVIKDMGADEAVTQLIVTTYDEDGVLLTTEQAAKEVQGFLVDEAKRINGIPALKKILTPAQPALQQPEPKAPTQTGMKTLSHSMAPISTAPAKTWAEKKAQIVAKYSKKA